MVKSYQVYTDSEQLASCSFLLPPVSGLSQNDANFLQESMLKFTRGPGRRRGVVGQEPMVSRVGDS